MKTKVYAVAETVPARAFPTFTAGKLYQVVWELNHGFDILDDYSTRTTCHWRASAPLDGGNWTRLELPDIDPRDVAELYEAARSAYLPLFCAAGSEAPMVTRLCSILDKIEKR